MAEYHHRKGSCSVRTNPYSRNLMIAVSDTNSSDHICHPFCIITDFLTTFYHIRRGADEFFIDNIFRLKIPFI